MKLLTKVLLTELLSIFDDLLPTTNESLMVYALEVKRADGYGVTLTVDGIADSVGVGVSSAEGVGITHLSLERCSSLRVLDEQRRILEIVADDGSNQRLRCVVAIDSNMILQCEYLVQGAVRT